MAPSIRLPQRRPPPLARRSLRFEVNESPRPDGPSTGLWTSDELTDIVRQPASECGGGCRLPASCLPQRCTRDLRGRQAIVEALPDIYVCRSSEVLAEFREFERTSTTVMNAFVGPRVAHYMGRLGRAIE